MVKQKNWPLHYTSVTSHLKRFDYRMKIYLCTGENVPDPPLNAAFGPLVFKYFVLLCEYSKTWRIFKTFEKSLIFWLLTLRFVVAKDNSNVESILSRFSFWKSSKVIREFRL